MQAVFTMKTRETKTKETHIYNRQMCLCFVQFPVVVQSTVGTNGKRGFQKCAFSSDRLLSNHTFKPFSIRQKYFVRVTVTRTVAPAAELHCTLLFKEVTRRLSDPGNQSSDTFGFILEPLTWQDVQKTTRCRSPRSLRSLNKFSDQKKVSEWNLIYQTLSDHLTMTTFNTS